jgi:thiosulfate dehydrogenase
MYDAAVRAAWWGGTVTTLLDATNQCVVQFMRGKALAPDDDKGRAIFVYLESLAPDASADTKALTVTQNIVDVPSGDATRGKMWWDQGCGNCHGAPHTGDGRISDVASLVPDDSLAAHGTDPKTGARPVVIEKVRHGKFYNVGGNMPLFSLEALSDAQLGDILAYLEGFGLPPSQ